MKATLELGQMYGATYFLMSLRCLKSANEKEQIIKGDIKKKKSACLLSSWQLRRKPVKLYQQLISAGDRHYNE